MKQRALFMISWLPDNWAGRNGAAKWHHRNSCSLELHWQTGTWTLWQECGLTAITYDWFLNILRHCSMLQQVEPILHAPAQLRGINLSSLIYLRAWGSTVHGKMFSTIAQESSSVWKILSADARRLCCVHAWFLSIWVGSHACYIFQQNFKFVLTKYSNKRQMDKCSPRHALMRYSIINYINMSKAPLFPSTKQSCSKPFLSDTFTTLSSIYQVPPYVFSSTTWIFDKQPNLHDSVNSFVLASCSPWALPCGWYA